MRTAPDPYAQSPHHAAALAAAFAVSVLCVVLDGQLGPTIQFPFFYLFPISLAAWFANRWWGLGLAVVLPLFRLFFHTIWDRPSTPFESSINAAIRITVFVLFAWLINRTARQMRQLTRLRLLEGMVGVCASCKRIRSTEGEPWQPLEAYLARRPQELFSETCPDCQAQSADVFDRR